MSRIFLAFSSYTLLFRDLSAETNGFIADRISTVCWKRTPFLIVNTRMSNPTENIEDLPTKSVSNGRTQVSVVIPSLNEADSLTELFDRLDKVASENRYEMQVVLVDDGSTDNSQEVVSNFLPKHISSIDYVRFRTNLGKSSALSEGIQLAQADLIITMDADLQDKPEEIPNLIAKLSQGYDVVSGWKRRRNDPFFRKKVPSYIFNWMVRKILGSELKDINCGLKAYKKEVWDEIRVYGEFHRFIPALAANRGFKIGEIEVDHAARTHGVSKYGARRFIRGVLDLITVFFLNSYRHRPLHFFGSLGGVIGGLGVLIGVYLSTLWFLGESIGSRPLLLLSILLIIVGVQVVLFGLMSQLQIEMFLSKYGERPPANVTSRTFSQKTSSSN